MIKEIWADITHGRGGYVNYDCRCDICKAGVRVFMRAYNKRRKEKGVCRACRRPVDPGNVLFCVVHRARERERQARARLGKERRAA